MGSERDFVRERIAAKKARIIALDAATSALASGAQSYQFDSGQTREMVTKVNYAALIDEQRRLEHEVLMLERRLCGSVVIARPRF